MVSALQLPVQGGWTAILFFTSCSGLWDILSFKLWAYAFIDARKK